VQLCVLEIMNDVSESASGLKSSDEQLRPIEYDTIREECDFLCYVGNMPIYLLSAVL